MIVENKVKEEVVISIEKKQEKEYKLIGSYFKRINGGKIWEYNVETSELKLAEFRSSDTCKIGSSNEKLDVNKKCIYVEAVNLKNALKHLRKGNFIFVS